MTAGLTSEQLEFLASRQHQQRTASALHSGGSINDSFWPRFETVEACQHEDRARAAALREFDDDALLENSNDDSDWLLERSADELATLLENIADPDRKLPAPPCLASSGSTARPVAAGGTAGRSRLAPTRCGRTATLAGMSSDRLRVSATACAWSRRAIDCSSREASRSRR